MCGEHGGDDIKKIYYCIKIKTNERCLLREQFFFFFIFSSTFFWLLYEMEWLSCFCCRYTQPTSELIKVYEMKDMYKIYAVPWYISIDMSISVYEYEEKRRPKGWDVLQSA